MKSNAEIKAMRTHVPDDEILRWAEQQKDNEFCQSIVAQFKKFGGLTFHQAAAICSVYERAQKTQAVDVPERVIEYMQSKINNPRVREYNKEFFKRMLALAESGQMTKAQLEKITKYM